MEFSPTDLIVLVTRPPLDDEPHDDKPVQRSGTDLEGRVLGALRTWFLEYCSRVEVRLHPRLRERLELKRPDAARRGCIEYSQKTGAYKSTWTHQFLGVPPVGREGGRLRTGGYLIFTPKGWPGGPGILAAFGMSGFQTMTWAQREGLPPRPGTGDRGLRSPECLLRGMDAAGSAARTPRVAGVPRRLRAGNPVPRRVAQE